MADIPVDSEQFLRLIWDGAPHGWWATLCSFPRGTYTDGEGPTDQHWYQLPRDWDTLLVHINYNKHFDLYLCPSLFQNNWAVDSRGKTKPGTGRTKENKAWTRVLHQDADECGPERFHATPTIQVSTSPGRWHAYWLLDQPLTSDADFTRAADLGRTVALTHREHGCDQGSWTPTKLLRLPGSRNNKYPTEPYEVTAHTNGLVYTLDRVADAYPQNDTSPTPVAPPVLEPFPLEIPTAADAFRLVQDHPVINQLLHTKGREPTPDRPGNRSQLTWLLLKRLAEAGIPKAAAMRLAWGTSYNKYRTRNQHPALFWNEVCKAYTTFGESEPETEGTEDTEQIVLEHHTSTPPIHLVRGHERQLSPMTVIDDYLAWVQTKTDAARQYHEAAFLTALGCIFGEYGRVPIKFESGYLNMWFMVLGGTTLSRKSTAMRMMIRLLRHLSDGVYDYVLGSDVTPEGLHDVLLDRGGLASLMYRDEVQGLRREAQAKSYLSGLEPKLTELYDGTVSGKIRVGSGRKREAETVFSLYLTGITDDVADGYEIRDFGSGHLARFCYIHATPPPLTRESVYVEQDTVEDVYDQTIDQPYELLLNRLRTSRAWWDDNVTKRGHQVKVPWDDDTWERYNQAKWDSMVWAKNHPHHKVLIPTVERTFHTVAKIATVLAMADRETRITMPYLIRTLLFTEQCLGYLCLVLDKVAATGRTRILEEILARLDVAAAKGLSFNQLYNHFKGHMPAGTFRAYISDLVESGAIVFANNRIHRARD